MNDDVSQISPRTIEVIHNLFIMWIWDAKRQE